MKTIYRLMKYTCIIDIFIKVLLVYPPISRIKTSTLMDDADQWYNMFITHCILFYNM